MPRLISHAFGGVDPRNAMQFVYAEHKLPRLCSTHKHRLGSPRGAGNPGDSWRLLATNTAADFEEAEPQARPDQVQLGEDSLT
jgi:hypothetical protein